MIFIIELKNSELGPREAKELIEDALAEIITTEEHLTVRNFRNVAGKIPAIRVLEG